MSLPKVRRLCALLLAFVLAFSFQLVAYATHNRYDDDDDSITLDAHYHEDDDSIYFLAGDTYELTLIARKSIDDDTLDVTYNIVDAYHDYDCDWPSTTASERLAIAKELAKIAVPDETGVTDKDGKLTFSDLDPGLYLVVRTRVAPANQEYIIDPYLVTLPIIEDGEVFEDIEVDEKFARIGGPRPSPTPSASPVPSASPTPAPSVSPTPSASAQPIPTPKPGGEPTPEPSPAPTPTITPVAPKTNLPQTGQLNWPVPVLIVMGLSLILLGGWLQRKSDHEK